MLELVGGLYLLGGCHRGRVRRDSHIALRPRQHIAERGVHYHSPLGVLWGDGHGLQRDGLGGFDGYAVCDPKRGDICDSGPDLFHQHHDRALDGGPPPAFLLGAVFFTGPHIGLLGFVDVASAFDFAVANHSDELLSRIDSRDWLAPARHFFPMNVFPLASLRTAGSLPLQKSQGMYLVCAGFVSLIPLPR